MSKTGSENLPRIVTCRDLRKEFVTAGKTTPIVSGVDLDVFEGDYTVLMGGSGSGKSTLLYLLSGLDKANAGTVSFAGEDLHKLSERAQAQLRREGMGFVFQAFNLIPTLSLIENVRLAGLLGNQDSLEATSMEILRDLDLADHASKRPGQLSGGQQQRGAIARALINNPRMLFADEPTGALNSAAGEAVLDLFDRLSTRGQSIFMVTHELRAACRGDRVLFMQDGGIKGDFRFADHPGKTTDRESLLFNWLTEQGW